MARDDKQTVTAEQALAAALTRLLTPVVRILLRYGIAYKMVEEIAKKVFVDVANSDFALPSRKMTTSRISLITGLTRREAARLLEVSDPDDSEIRNRHNRIRRLISGWSNDGRFLNKRGRPMPLPLEGEVVSFGALVRLHGNDVPVRAVLDELVRLGVVDQTSDGRIRLIARAYIPAKTDVDKIEMLGSDVADLVATIEHNLVNTAEKPMFQRKVVYDDLPDEVIGQLRESANTRGQTMLEQMERELRRHDRSTNPNAKGSGRNRLVLGLYVREEDAEVGED